ncbi:hypothetical protein DID76_01210 [Candidatus Marinamargulisbacteria bacterium SCGC AG-414-C22]|nr:hypothetical protein DID76_01210 [Candidatus Marinamargulisbacteria bacterium SCGC AG-414-C22]
MILFKIISSNLRMDQLFIYCNVCDQLCTEFQSLIRHHDISCDRVRDFLQKNIRNFNVDLNKLFDNLDPNDKLAPLHIAVQTAVTKRDDSLVRLLLDYGANPNIRCGKRSSEWKSGLTPLYLLIINFKINSFNDTSTDHYIAIIELLLQYGADTNIPDYHGCVPMMNLVGLFNQKKCNRLISLLISYGTNTYQLDKDNDNIFTECSKKPFIHRAEDSWFASNFIILLKTIDSIDVSFSSKGKDTIFGLNFFSKCHFNLCLLKLICMVSHTKKQLLNGLCTKSKYFVQDGTHEYTPLTMAVENKQFSALNFLFMHCGKELFQYHEDLHPGLLLKTAIDVACPKTVAFFLHQIKLDISKSYTEILSHMKYTEGYCIKQNSSSKNEQSLIGLLLSIYPSPIHSISIDIADIYSIEYDPKYRGVEFGNIDFFTSFDDEEDGVSYLQKIVDAKSSTCSEHDFLLHCLVTLNFYQEQYSDKGVDQFAKEQKLSLLDFFLKKEPINFYCIDILLISGVNIWESEEFIKIITPKESTSSTANSADGSISDIAATCASDSHSHAVAITSEVPQKRQKKESVIDKHLGLLLCVLDSIKCDLLPILSHFESDLDQLFTKLIENHRMDVFNRLIKQVIKQDIFEHEVSSDSGKEPPQKKQKNMASHNLKWIVDLFELFIQKNCFSGVKIILSNTIEFSTDDWTSITQSIGKFGTPPMINYLLGSSFVQEILSQHTDELLYPLMLRVFKDTKDTTLLNSFCSKILHSTCFRKDEMIVYFVSACFQLSDTEDPIHFLKQSDLLSELRRLPPSFVLNSPLVQHLKNLFKYLLTADKEAHQDFIINSTIYYCSFFNELQINHCSDQFKEAFNFVFVNLDRSALEVILKILFNKPTNELSHLNASEYQRLKDLRFEVSDRFPEEMPILSILIYFPEVFVTAINKEDYQTVINDIKQLGLPFLKKYFLFFAHIFYTRETIFLDDFNLIKYLKLFTEVIISMDVNKTILESIFCYVSTVFLKNKYAHVPNIKYFSYFIEIYSRFIIDDSKESKEQCQKLICLADTVLKNHEVLFCLDAIPNLKTYVRQMVSAILESGSDQAKNVLLKNTYQQPFYYLNFKYFNDNYRKFLDLLISIPALGVLFPKTFDNMDFSKEYSEQEYDYFFKYLKMIDDFLIKAQNAGVLNRVEYLIYFYVSKFHENNYISYKFVVDYIQGFSCSELKKISIDNRVFALDIFLRQHMEYSARLFHGNVQTEFVQIKSQISLFKLLIERFCSELKISDLEGKLGEQSILCILEIISLTTVTPAVNFTLMCQFMNITIPQSEALTTNPFSNVSAKYLPYVLILILNNKDLKDYDEYILSHFSQNKDAIECFIDKLLRTDWIMHFLDEDNLDRANTILKQLLGKDISTFCSKERNLFLLKRIDVINVTDFSSQFIKTLEGYEDHATINGYYKTYNTLLNVNGFQDYLGTQDNDDEDANEDIQRAVAPYLYSCNDSNE